MTKADLVEKIYLLTEYTKTESAEIVDMIFDVVKNKLAEGEKIKLAGFGNFEVREKNARRGRNPHTGEAIEISARRTLSFKPSKILTDAMNQRA